MPRSSSSATQRTVPSASAERTVPSGRRSTTTHRCQLAGWRMISFNDECCKRGNPMRTCSASISSLAPASPILHGPRCSSRKAGLLCPLRKVEPLRTLRLIDDVGSVPIGFTHLGAFRPPHLYADVATHRVLAFDSRTRTGQQALYRRTLVG